MAHAPRNPSGRSDAGKSDGAPRRTGAGKRSDGVKGPNPGKHTNTRSRAKASGRDDPAGLSGLFHRRWTLPVLAGLHREGGGAKFITLIHRLGVSRDALRRTLTTLIRQGLVMRNPGYGHPLRPEYILAPTGRNLAPFCQRLLAALQRVGAEDSGLRKWSLVTLAAVADGCGRFSEIRAALPTITPRALTLTLKRLQDAGLLTRVVYDDYPPIVEYRPTAAGLRLTRMLDDLAAVI